MWCALSAAAGRRQAPKSGHGECRVTAHKEERELGSRSLNGESGHGECRVTAHKEERELGSRSLNGVSGHGECRVTAHKEERELGSRSLNGESGHGECRVTAHKEERERGSRSLNGVSGHGECRVTAHKEERELGSRSLNGESGHGECRVTAHKEERELGSRSLNGESGHAAATAAAAAAPAPAPLLARGCRHLWGPRAKWRTPWNMSPVVSLVAKGSGRLGHRTPTLRAHRRRRCAPPAQAGPPASPTCHPKPPSPARHALVYTEVNSLSHARQRDPGQQRSRDVETHNTKINFSKLGKEFCETFKFPAGCPAISILALGGNGRAMASL
ncbi:uncharacterized protein LOC132647944 [Meriones unguiculatus]|uniref:uncharacterized protein LOC132647944 n=1 Tax=Meriones unguiculatus TaxID=10047 RepID=UPI00293F0D0C|nr:uncharacterized protein LOC132647944 [Meriones unguiculatus]